jgi:chlorite dismutase
MLQEMEITSPNGITSFIGASTGQWKVLSIKTIVGSALPIVDYVSTVKGVVNLDLQSTSSWIIKSFTSNLRYTKRDEKQELNEKSRTLGNPEFNHAAMIPIKKSEAWWQLAQDERRKIFEEDSKHIQSSTRYLPFISRQLHHSRDLGEDFDFVTWFEFSSKHDEEFNSLCYTLRKTEEWKYVDREIDIRMVKV